MAFPQAPMELPLCMHLPQLHTENPHSETTMKHLQSKTSSTGLEQVPQGWTSDNGFLHQ